MTCGMLFGYWIKWGVDIKTPAYVIKQGYGINAISLTEFIIVASVAAGVTDRY